MNQRTCPVCERGTLTAATETIFVEHEGHRGEVQSRYSVCSYCECQLVGPVEALFNKNQMISFKNSVTK